MNDRVCYVAMGAEGSGTYMLAEALVSSGCTYKQGEDELVMFSVDSPAVIHRSFPHAGRWLNANKFIATFVKMGWKVKPVYIMRTHAYAAKSVVRRDSTRSIKDAINNVCRADSYVLRNLLGVCELVQYEAFVDSKKYRKHIFGKLGLPPPTIEFYNANDKYRSNDDKDT